MEQGGPRTELVGTGALTPAALLGEQRAKQALREYGLSVSTACSCASVTEAVCLANEIGYPVVLKAEGDGFAHKTELGAVALNLVNEQAVEAIATKFLGLEGANGVTVEAMVTDAVAEIIVGVSRDATLGLGLTLGTGGIFTELLDDVVTLLLPSSRGEIEQAILRLRGAKLLEGYRAAPPATRRPWSMPSKRSPLMPKTTPMTWSRWTSIRFLSGRAAAVSSPWMH